jgi:hypothetical protein
MKSVKIVDDLKRSFEDIYSIILTLDYGNKQLLSSINLFLFVYESKWWWLIFDLYNWSNVAINMDYYHLKNIWRFFL